MKKILIAAICLLAAAALFFFYKSNQPPPAAENPPVTATAANRGSSPAPANSRPPGVALSPAPAAPGNANASAPLSASPQPQDLSARAGQFVPPIADTNVPPQAAVQNIRRAVRQYDQTFGGDPVGNNPEITAQLTGKNPKQINFLTGVDGMTVNQNGELVDAWGTPYFFHALSGSDMEVRSAGPDRRMWTSDDIVTR